MFVISPLEFTDNSLKPDSSVGSVLQNNLKG